MATPDFKQRYAVKTSHASTYSFDQVEAVIRSRVDPIIKRQFEQSSTLYTRFTEDKHPWNKDLESYTRLLRGELEIPHESARCSECRIALDLQIAILMSYRPNGLHTWLDEDGMADYTRIMRGEMPLPHQPRDCADCREVFMAQLAALKAHGRASALDGRKRNPGRLKSFRRTERIRERLRKLARSLS